MKGPLQCGTIVVSVTSDLSLRCWTVVTGQFIFCVYIPLVICLCLGRVWAFIAVLVGSC